MFHNITVAFVLNNVLNTKFHLMKWLSIYYLINVCVNEQLVGYYVE